MMTETKKFFICNHCKNIVGMIQDKGVPMQCCGEAMQELVANTTEAATEKHLPVVTVEGDTITVAVGSVAHPMTAEHYITYVYLETEQGGQRKCGTVDGEPVFRFRMIDDKPIAAYAYCNLHGLWKTSI